MVVVEIRVVLSSRLLTLVKESKKNSISSSNSTTRKFLLSRTSICLYFYIFISFFFLCFFYTYIPAKVFIIDARIFFPLSLIYILDLFFFSTLRQTTTTTTTTQSPHLSPSHQPSYLALCHLDLLTATNYTFSIFLFFFYLSSSNNHHSAKGSFVFVYSKFETLKFPRVNLQKRWRPGGMRKDKNRKK